MTARRTSETRVVAELLDELALGADRVGNLEQQRPNQALRPGSASDTGH